MNIPEQLAPYAARLGFPGSEAMARILAILFDDPDSVVCCRGHCRVLLQIYRPRQA